MNDNEGVYAEFRSSVKSLTEKAVTREYILECERDRRPPLEVLKRVADQGWLELGITKKGEIPDYVATAILLEELSYGYFGAGDLAYRALIHAANTIGKFAKESIRGEYLERVAKGDLLCCNSVTEPDSGSDAASIRTRAVKDGSDYIINGHKIFNSGMHFVDYAVCYTRTSVGERRHDGITALLVPAKSPGIHVSILDTAGHRSSAACEVWYEDVRVSEEMLLGEEGRGWDVLVSHLDAERLAIAALSLGAMRRVVDDAVEYAKNRKQFGRVIGQFQAVAHMLADMRILSDASSALTYSLAASLDKGATSGADPAVAKAFVTEAYEKVSDRGLQVWGAYGYVFESDINRHWRDARVGTIGGGSSQIMRNIIAKSMGLEILR